MNWCALEVNYTHVIPISQPLDTRLNGQKGKIWRFKVDFLKIYRLRNRSGEVVARLMKTRGDGRVVKNKTVRKLGARTDGDVISNDAIINQNIGTDYDVGSQ